MTCTQRHINSKQVLNMCVHAGREIKETYVFLHAEDLIDIQCCMCIISCFCVTVSFPIPYE